MYYIYNVRVSPESSSYRILREIVVSDRLIVNGDPVDTAAGDLVFKNKKIGQKNEAQLLQDALNHLKELRGQEVVCMVPTWRAGNWHGMLLIVQDKT